MKVVLDTNILVAGLRSSLGASFGILDLLDQGRFIPVLTTPLCLEYADVLYRPSLIPLLAEAEIDAFLDFFTSVASCHEVSFLWRPFLPDPKDDLVLEAALAGGASTIVTRNYRDFKPAVSMGIRVMTPGDFLRMIRAL